MTVFSCARCGHRLTGNLHRISVPAGSAIPGPAGRVPRVRPGTFAIDHEPFGPLDIGSAAPRGTVLVSSADLRGTRPHHDPVRRAGCCGPSGTHGPNLVCAVCGGEVATEQRDCWTGTSVHLEPGAVAPRNRRRKSRARISGRPSATA